MGWQLVGRLLEKSTPGNTRLTPKFPKLSRIFAARASARNLSLKNQNVQCSCSPTQKSTLTCTLRSGAPTVFTTLGSDCAFFIYNTPMLATGRGEILQPVAVNLSGYALLLVKPPLSVSTAEAYAGVSPKAPAADLRSIVSQGVEGGAGQRL
jgi:hypothetical protein